jgi:hypothetical protein
MPQSNQDFSTARRFHLSSYECEPPPDVRAELVRPRRPRILKRPPERSRWEPRHSILAFAFLMLAGAVLTNLLHPARESIDSQIAPSPEQSATPAATPVPTPQPAPLAPAPTPHTSWQSYLAAEQTRAPRAQLVKLSPPRAQLVRPDSLPSPVPGRQYLATMPYNVEVLATYRGRLDAEWMLPQSGNAIGDMWLVDTTPWVWIWAPGANRADWIDP